MEKFLHQHHQKFEKHEYTKTNNTELVLRMLRTKRLKQATGNKLGGKRKYMKCN